MRLERMRNLAQELQEDQLSIEKPRTSLPRLWPSLEEQMGSDFRRPAQMILRFEKLRQSKVFQLRVHLLNVLGGRMTAPPPQEIKETGILRKIRDKAVNFPGEVIYRAINPDDFKGYLPFLEEFQLLKEDPTGLSYLAKVSEEWESPSYNLGVSAYKTLHQAAVLAGIPKDTKF